MNSNEAKSLSDKHKMPIEIVFENIKNVASAGYDTLLLSPVTEDTIMKLIDLGYKINSHKDPYNGFKLFICSW